jgi:hypothetical protein
MVLVCHPPPWAEAARIDQKVGRPAGNFLKNGRQAPGFGEALRFRDEVAKAGGNEVEF